MFFTREKERARRLSLYLLLLIKNRINNTINIIHTITSPNIMIAPAPSALATMTMKAINSITVSSNIANNIILIKLLS